MPISLQSPAISTSTSMPMARMLRKVGEMTRWEPRANPRRDGKGRGVAHIYLPQIVKRGVIERRNCAIQ
jgi:hypothetical protein